jgi:hypothetical protein
VDGRWLSAGLASGEHGDGGAEALNGGRKPPFFGPFFMVVNESWWSHVYGVDGE